MNVLRVGRTDSAHGINLDRLTPSKGNTAICDGPRSRWEDDDRAYSGDGPRDKTSIDGIQVVRVVEQDTLDMRGDNGEPSDSESTRKLVRGWI